MKLRTSPVATAKTTTTARSHIVDELGQPIHSGGSCRPVFHCGGVSKWQYALSWLIASGGTHWHGVSTDTRDFPVLAGGTVARAPAFELRVPATSFRTRRRCSTSRVEERLRQHSLRCLARRRNSGRPLCCRPGKSAGRAGIPQVTRIDLRPPFVEQMLPTVSTVDSPVPLREVQPTTVENWTVSWRNESFPPTR